MFGSEQTFVKSWFSTKLWWFPFKMMNFSGFLTVWGTKMMFRIHFCHESMPFSLQNSLKSILGFQNRDFPNVWFWNRHFGSSIAIYTLDFVDFGVYAVLVIVFQLKTCLTPFLNAFRKHQNTVEDLYTELPYTNLADFGARPWCIAVALWGLRSRFWEVCHTFLGAPGIVWSP